MTTVCIMIPVDLGDVGPLTPKQRFAAKRDVDNLIMEGLIRKKAVNSDDAVFNYAVILPDDMPAVLKRDCLGPHFSERKKESQE